jgi:hypothetical protein
MGDLGGNSSNDPRIPATLEDAMGEAVWTGSGAPSNDADPVFKPLTKDQSAKAIQDTKDAVKAIDDKFHMHFKDGSSEHTLVYSTAGADDVPELAAKAEQAYSTALRVFASQSKQVVLPGKLLVYILDKASLYQSFAKDADSYSVPKGVVGYTWFADDGSGGLHIVMGPPPDDLIDHNVKPIVAWQAAMTRTMTFAILNRFHSSRPVPAWVMQGLADVAADSILPQPLNRARAYLYSQQKGSNVIEVLNDKRDGDFSAHPLMQTLTETLLLRDRTAYGKFILAIKDGKPTSDALQSSYKWSFDQLGDAWTTYVKRFGTPS